MGKGSHGLGRNQRGLQVGWCEMVGDYYDDSSVEENLNLLLRLTRVEANVDSEVSREQGFLRDFLKEQELGASSASLSNDRLHKTYQGVYKERTLKSSMKTQRDPRIQGE